MWETYTCAIRQPKSLKMVKRLGKNGWNEQSFNQFLHTLSPKKKSLVHIQEKQD